VIDWGIQLCNALSYLYEKWQLVHRDIKPANIIISPSGQLKITDFGLARVALHPEITQTKMMLGTIVYMPPEQLLDPTTVDNRADIFAIGAVLFKALTGNLPFAAEDVSGMAHRLLYDTPDDPQELNPLLPPTLAKIVMHCLAKDADERYPSARALASDLQNELKNPAIYLAQGRCHAERQEWKDATHCFQQAAALDGDSAEAWFDLGNALEAQEQWAPAFDCFLKVIHADPSAIAAYRRLGKAYRRRGDDHASLEAALRMTERAWTLDPTDLATSLELVALRCQLTQYVDALELAEDLTRRHPDCSRTFLELGRILYRLARREEALAAFRTAHQLEPREFAALFNLATILFELRQIAEAEDLFLKAVALEVNHTAAQHNLALLWFEQQRYQEAAELLQAIIERDPNPASYELLGLVLIEQQRLPAALACLQHALDLGGSWETRLTMARTLAHCFRYQEAIGSLQVSINIAPAERRAPLFFLLADLAIRSGNPVEANKALRNCLAEHPAAELAAQAQNLLNTLHSSMPGAKSMPRASSHPRRRRRQHIFGKPLPAAAQ
ncbi:MAG: tetratricopeptide repeat protein, partial [Cyanobacteria bacterium NC_groundwater_1444_Ag_S-0.65um_54_12]|nr:tetratricopeptide repeat protein [Cyanobacteria bacterium NC_groundwater_1444_Ag_S-0.65um_54_12]